MEKINLSYIWINRDDKYDRTIPHYEINKMIINLKKIYLDELNIKVYFYEDIYELLLSYDKELAYYFSIINPNYAALLSDIGRIMILYSYGGIYQDIKLSIGSQKFLEEIRQYFNKGLDIIFQKHHRYNRIRNTNIACSKKGLKIFDDCLQEMKSKIKKLLANDNFENNVFPIGSGTLINLVENQSLPTNEKNEDIPIFQYKNIKFIKIEWKLINNHSTRKYNKGNQHWSKLTEPLFIV